MIRSRFAFGLSRDELNLAVSDSGIAAVGSKRSSTLAGLDADADAKERYLVSVGLLRRATQPGRWTIGAPGLGVFSVILEAGRAAVLAALQAVNRGTCSIASLSRRLGLADHRTGHGFAPAPTPPPAPAPVHEPVAVGGAAATPAPSLALAAGAAGPGARGRTSVAGRGGRRERAGGAHASDAIVVLGLPLLLADAIGRGVIVERRVGTDRILQLAH